MTTPKRYLDMRDRVEDLEVPSEAEQDATDWPPAKARRLAVAAAILPGLLAMPRYRDREMPPPNEVIPEALRYADALIAAVDNGD